MKESYSEESDFYFTFLSYHNIDLYSVNSVYGVFFFKEATL